MKKNTNIQMSLDETKKLCALTYWKKQEAQSQLFTLLDKLSVRTEEQLTKKDLYELITKVYAYTKALNIYNYYCSEHQKALIADGRIKVGELNG